MAVIIRRRVLVRPPGLRPPPITSVTGEPEVPPLTYDPVLQADIAQMARSRGTMFDVGQLPGADIGAGTTPGAQAGAPGAAGAGGAAGAAAASSATVSVPTMDLSRFKRTAKIVQALTTASVLALAAPPALRTFLLIRADVNNTVNVFVDFDYPAGPQCGIILIPGAYAFFDQFIPQGDVYLAQAATALTQQIAVVTFANSSMTGA